MSDLDIVRAWKDEEYRLSLSDEQFAMLPDNPAGLVEITNPLRTEGLRAVDSVSDTCITVCPTINYSCITVCPTLWISCITVCPVEPVIM